MYGWFNFYDCYDPFCMDFYYSSADSDPKPRTPYKPKGKQYIPDRRMKNHRCRSNC